MRVLVLADTHLRPGRARSLPPAVHAQLARCDLVLHAGDVVTHHLLDELGATAPVLAVLGNNDHELAGVLPRRHDADLDGVRVAMVHDSGPAKGRPARLRRWFPTAQVVVFGHSHLPQAEWHDGLLLFNPGSAIERRRAPVRTFGLLEVDAGRILRHAIVPID